MCGDFNMVMYVAKKSPPPISICLMLSPLATWLGISGSLNFISLIIALLGPTWGVPPSYFNLVWDFALAACTISSLSRTTSDHIPLKVCVSTSAPLATIFHFNNVWNLHTGFKEMVIVAWHINSLPADAATSLALILKRVRKDARVWIKRIGSIM